MEKGYFSRPHNLGHSVLLPIGANGSTENKGEQLNPRRMGGNIEYGRTIAKTTVVSESRREKRTKEDALDLTRSTDTIDEFPNQFARNIVTFEASLDCFCSKVIESKSLRGVENCRSEGRSGVLDQAVATREESS